MTMSKQSHCVTLNVDALIPLGVLQLCDFILKKQAYDEEEIHSVMKRRKNLLHVFRVSQKPLITGQSQMKCRTDRVVRSRRTIFASGVIFRTVSVD